LGYRFQELQNYAAFFRFEDIWKLGERLAIISGLAG
jgi:hypothetical protein